LFVPGVNGRGVMGRGDHRGGLIERRLNVSRAVERRRFRGGGQLEMRELLLQVQPLRAVRPGRRRRRPLPAGLFRGAVSGVYDGGGQVTERVLLLLL